MRRPDWYARLMAWGRGARQAPIRFGHHDCALFAAGSVEAMTGVDHAAPFRGRYTTLRGGLRVLRWAGHRDHIDLAASHLPEIAPAFAQAGDLAVVAAEPLPALGVVVGEAIWVMHPDGGLGHVPLTAAVRAFRV